MWLFMYGGVVVVFFIHLTFWKLLVQNLVCPFNVSFQAMLVAFLVGWLYFTSHRQRGHLETAPPFTVPCEGREARFLNRSHRESNPGSLRGSPLNYLCATPAPFLDRWLSENPIACIISLYFVSIVITYKYTT